MRSTEIGKAFIGSAEVDKVYLGNDLVYSKGIPNGVYIYHTNGKLYKPGEWDTANNPNAVGVAVLTDDCKFVVAPTENSSTQNWSKDRVLIPGITTTDYMDIAKADYKGKQNTDAWVAHYGLDTDYAAGWCRNYTFKNGKKGYLGGLGEWWTLFNNKSAIDAALSKCGGSALQTRVYFSSTQYSKDNVRSQWLDNGYVDISRKDYSRFVRAFAPL